MLYDEFKPKPTDEVTLTIKISAHNWEDRETAILRALREGITEIPSIDLSYGRTLKVAEGNTYQAELSINPVITEEMREQELYKKACLLVAQSQQASVSLIQRRLRIGYVKAAKFIEAMERDGFISPYAGSAPRKVFIRSKK